MSNVIVINWLTSTQPVSTFSTDKISGYLSSLIGLSELSLNIEVVLRIAIVNMLITVVLVVIIVIIILLLRISKVATRGLLHHDHLLGFSAPLFDDALHIRGTIRCAAPSQLLNVVSDCIQRGLGPSLWHDGRETAIFSWVNVRLGWWVCLVIEVQSLEFSRLIRRILPITIAWRRMNCKVGPHHLALLPVRCRYLWVLLKLAACCYTWWWYDLIQLNPSILTVLLDYQLI